MYLSILRTAILLTALSLTSLASAQAETQITGLTCKNHLRRAVLTPTWVRILNDAHGLGSAGSLRISGIAGVTPTPQTNFVINRMAEVIRDCEQHCGGLRGNNGNMFQCDRLGEASSDQLAQFVESDQYLSDDAETEFTAEQLAELFDENSTDGGEVEAAAPVAPEATPEVVVENTREQPASETTTGTHSRSNYWINRVRTIENEVEL
jgi:hypothetical protein